MMSKQLDLDYIFDIARKALIEQKRRNIGTLSNQRKGQAVLDSLAQFEDREINELKYRDGSLPLISTTLRS